MPNVLRKSLPTFLPHQHSLFFSLSKICLQDEVKWRRHEWQDDREASKAPSPGDVVVEIIGGLRTCKG